MESPLNCFWLMTPTGRDGAVGVTAVNQPLAESGFFYALLSARFIILFHLMPVQILAGGFCLPGRLLWSKMIKNGL